LPSFLPPALNTLTPLAGTPPQIDVRLYYAAAPIAVNKLKALVKSGCERCYFYRAEGNNVTA